MELQKQAKCFHEQFKSTLNS